MRLNNVKRFVTNKLLILKFGILENARFALVEIKAHAPHFIFIAATFLTKRTLDIFTIPPHESWLFWFHIIAGGIFFGLKFIEKTRLSINIFAPQKEHKYQGLPSSQQSN